MERGVTVPPRSFLMELCDLGLTRLTALLTLAFGKEHFDSAAGTHKYLTRSCAVKKAADARTNALFRVSRLFISHCSGYNWDDQMIRGFSHTRLVGAGVADLGNIAVMPVLIPPLLEGGSTVEDFGFGIVHTSPLKWWSTYDKATEAASPGQYSVELIGPNATAELLAISRFAGLHRYSFNSETGDFPEADRLGASRPLEPALAVDVCHAGSLSVGSDWCRNASISVAPNGQSFDAWVSFKGSLSGDVVPIYLHGSLPTSAAGAVVSSWTVCDREKHCRTLSSGESASSTSGVFFAIAHLARRSVTVAQVYVGLSFQSEELARANLAHALGGSAVPSLESLAEATQLTWCSALNALSVVPDDSDVDLPEMLHTAHYRTLQTPTVYTEPGGSGNGSTYIGLDQKVHSSNDDAANLGGCGEASILTGSVRNTAQVDLDPASFDAWVASSQTLSSAHFSDFSNWDIFRDQLPWTLLTQEPVAMGVLRSMAAMTQQQGAFPRWPLANHEGNCMIGQHAASAILDALFAFTAAGPSSALAASCGTWGAVATALAAAVQPTLNAQATEDVSFNGREDLTFYLENGFVSIEATDHSAVSTLTFAFDDYILGALSEQLALIGGGGLDVSTLETAAAGGLSRAKNYAKVWSKSQLFMCPRSNGSGNYTSSDDGTDDGSGQPLVCPELADKVAMADKWYREGDAWHYAHWVPHDVPGLVDLHPSPQVSQSLNTWRTFPLY